MRILLAVLPALLLGACMGSSEAPVASQAPVQAVPVAPVTSSALPPPGQSAPPPATAAPRASAQPLPSSPLVSSQPSTAGMARAPGARESVGLTNVSRTSSGAGTSGNALGGTITSGQTAGIIPSTVDRNREPPRRRSTAPRDPLGPGTPPPVIDPTLRDTTGNSVRNRQQVQF